MILKREIEQHAEKEGVPKTTIDKDWVLGHFLDAIYSIPTTIFCEFAKLLRIFVSNKTHHASHKNSAPG